ncbi:zinc finger domain-containing protein [Streptomyces sp. P11-1]|uniref:zinc finger domain-containing protein n=1 Tax=Streptomyces sp. P11-1 TaxID=3423221 RepID=UPI003D2F3FFA
MNTQPPPRSASEAMRRALGPQVSGALARGIAQGQQRAAEPAVSGVSSEEAAANVTAAVPMLAAAGLPAVEACTDPRHTGPIRSQLGCTGPDPAETVEQPADMVEGPEDAARRFARRLRAVELLCSGRPGYHTITVKALLTAMGEADEDGQEQPPGALLDPFTEAAVRRGALLGGALAIEALPQDFECDPGRGDAVKLLRRLAGLTSTTEQPTGLTWEARAEHAVRLYAATAIERDDLRAENGRLRERLAELERSAAELAALDAHGVDNWGGYDEAIASLRAGAELEQDQAEQPLVVPKVGDRYVSRNVARTVTVSRVWEPDTGHIAVAYGWRDDRPGECGSACPLDVFHREYEPVEQPLAFPQLVVPCPQCKAPARQLCTSHGGTRQRTNDTHQDRTKAYRAQQAGR